MKKAYLIILLFCSFLNYSCLEDKRDNIEPSQSGQTQQELGKKNNKLIDNGKEDGANLTKGEAPSSMEQGLLNAHKNDSMQVDSSKNDQAVPQIVDNESEEESGENNSIIPLIALALSVVSFLLVVWLWRICSKEDKEKNKRIEDINKNLYGIRSQIKELDLELQKKDTKSGTKDITQLFEKAQKLEQLIARITNTRFETDVPSNNKPVTGYFGMFSSYEGETFFRESFSSKGDRAYFKMMQVSRDIFEFEPLSLSKIKSLPNLNNVVYSHGKVSLEEATDMKVLKRGTAKFHSEDNFWELKEKVEIEIF